MKRITTLSSHITAKIAAGEVIERPAYAVKELIENALDANSSDIYIEIENSGLDKITVIDNGEGIHSEDILLSFLPHTTSKIHSEDELHAIKTLGFRGEALSSIAAISQLTIQSRQEKDISGTKVVVLSNELLDLQPIGMPYGTKVVVEQLFGSVPVRKKFLKSARTEFRNIVDIVTDTALISPSVGFELMHNNKQLFKLPKNQQLKERIATLLGDSLIQNSIPFSFDESYLQASGFLGKPQISFSGSSKVFLFVNNRRVYDPLIISSIKDAYSNLLEKYTYPFVLLSLRVPFELVDVNIHPRKEQVKFTDPHLVALSLIKGLKQTLEENNLTFYNISWKSGLTKTPIATQLRKELEHVDIAQLAHIKNESEISQIHNLYLVVETAQGLMMIDQHAAHEAVLFENLKQKYLEKKHDNQTVQLPQAIFIELSVSEMQVLQEFEDYFINLGFIIEEFGSNTIKISGVPAFFESFDMRALFAEILADFVNQDFPKEIDERSLKMLAYLACRSAIKSGETLTLDQRKKLIDSLEEHHFTYTCPHGRPVKIEFSLRELDTLFKRR
jgi:DNA mismatch repair protein MutL